MMPEGLIARASGHGPGETMDRLVTAVTGHGMRVMARIDHAAAASEVGMTLRPTEVLIFGNARAGTPLMQMSETIGLDLPLRVLVWQGDDGVTRIAYTDPAWLARRHGVEHAATASAMTSTLEAMAAEAAR
jgi:uncharacterized protein (DUF302 family)